MSMSKGKPQTNGLSALARRLNYDRARRVRIQSRQRRQRSTDRSGIFSSSNSVPTTAPYPTERPSSLNQSIDDQAHLYTVGEILGTSPSANRRPLLALNRQLRRQSVRRILSKLIAEREKTLSLSKHPMPWFGLDIGGTLVKLVYFEPTDKQVNDNQEAPIVQNIHKYLTSERAYAEAGLRDDHLQLNGQSINGRIGRLHFIRFPTEMMLNFLRLAKIKGLAAGASTVCATGGGAHKYEKEVRKEFNLEWKKVDELQALISGIQSIAEHWKDECYYYDKPLHDESTVPYHRRGRGNSPLQPPYLVVNIGSGVSILGVDGMNEFRRVSGTSLGGGMFHGLCCKLCDCQTFEEALELASKGDNFRVDKLVRDIYGGDYREFGLPGDTVAASFGQMIHEEKRKMASREDLARAVLVTVTNNIAQLSRMCAQNEKIDTILFVGNFLRVNAISRRFLAFAMDYWSKGAMKAVFLNHEGYFGAVGCLMMGLS